MAGARLPVLTLMAMALWGADPGFVSTKTSEMVLSARLLIESEEQKKAVGSDLDRQYVIVEVKIEPRGGRPIELEREHFLLRSERDNERSTAESPDRMAGSAVLVLGSRGGGRGMFADSGDPVIVGGVPGTGGRPRRIGSEDTIGSGGTPAETTVAASKVKEEPLLEALRQREMPLGETRKPVAGYLYFPVNPKQKAKNFYLHYKGPGGVCEVRFK